MLLGWKYLTADDEDRIARGVVQGGVHGGPWAMEIQPTNVCNVDCFFCSSKFHRAGEFLPWEDLLLPTLTRAADGDLKAVRLSGGGESLVYPKLGAMLDLFGNRGIRVADVTTNCTALGKVAAQLVDVGLDSASLSLNEPTAELFASTMRAPERLFDKAIEGIRALSDAAAKAPADKRPVLDLKFMVWRGNFREVPRMVALGIDLGVTRIHLNNIIGLPAEKRLDANEQAELSALLGPLIDEDLKRAEPLLDIWLDSEPAVQQAVYQHYWNRRPNHVVGMGDIAQAVELAIPTRRVEFCLMGWYTVTIAATGKVFPCCNFVGLPGKDLGQLGEESLEAIWRGAKYERFRDEFRRLMLLKGEMRHSPKLDQYIEPGCIAHRECPWGWCLARPEFYRQLADRMDQDAPMPRRLEAQGRDMAIRVAHRVRSLAGR